MRYYVYIDKDLIKGLVASYGTLDFNIDFIEYSVQKSFGSMNNLRAQPVKEKLKDGKEDEKNRNQISIGVETSSNCNVVTEQRYINIQDISDIRNISFYHNLIEKLRDEIKNNNRSSTKIIEHIGKVVKVRNDKDPLNNVFIMNNDMIWYSKENAMLDMDFFTDVCGEINVIGYDINSNVDRGTKMLKAIAIYVE